MMELLEHAQRMAEQFTEHALQVQQRRRQDGAQPQWIVNGQVICIDCEYPVGILRLKAVPDACRCVDCQNITDLKMAHIAKRNPWT